MNVQNQLDALVKGFYALGINYMLSYINYIERNVFDFKIILINFCEVENIVCQFQKTCCAEKNLPYVFVLLFVEGSVLHL